ncbi:MAG: hypothetical protein DRJ09_02690 [Bacteroidetes bacterium]|nr:MAG: hypothetical protein DRJ09_02690 [Bacteroidota bacterium]
MYKKIYCLFYVAILLLTIGVNNLHGKSRPVEDGMSHKSTFKPEIDSLLSRAKKQQDANPERAFNSAATALKLIQQNEADGFLSSLAYFQMGKACFLMGLNDSSLVYFKKILECPMINSHIKGNVYNSMCLAYRKSGKYSLALTYADSALFAFRQISDSANIAYALVNKAKVYYFHGESEKAMNLLFDVLNQFEERSNPLIQTEVLGEIANIYMDLGNIDKAKRFYLKSIKNCDSFNNLYAYADVLNNYGTLLYEEKDYDSALIYYYMARKTYEKAGQEDGVAVASQNIGITYVFLGQPKKGIFYLKNALNTFTSLQLKNDMASALVDLGTAFMEVKQYDSAAVCFHKVLDITAEIKNTYFKKEALKFLYKLKRQTNDYKSAFEYYQQYVTFKDSIDNLSMQRNLQELEIKYKTAEHEKEIMHLKDQELIEKADNRFLVGMISSIVLLSLLLLFGLWVKRKKDIQLHKQKLLTSEKEKKLMKEKITRQKAIRDQLENKLEFKNRQLASHALHMMQKNTLLQELTSGIESKMNNADSKEKQNLNEIKYHLQKGLNAEKDWELFKLYFEQVNERFFDKLREINPYLTENDYKLCALMKLNMNIKEMAAVLNISPNSLKNARYRLKKKINLNVDDKLNIFLNGL